MVQYPTRAVPAKNAGMSHPTPLVAVVDDEESVRRALQRLLRSAGMEVVTFASGREFLAIVAEQPPDCVVLDLHMPGLSGFDVMEAAPQGLPIVAITGHDSREARARAGRAQAYLDKPVADEVLIETIAAVLTFSDNHTNPQRL